MKTVKLLLLFVAATTISLGSYAQKSKSEKPFAGTIKYEVSIQGEMDATTKAQMPTEITITYSEGKMRMDQPSLMQSTSVIYDMIAKSMVILIDAMGQQMALTSQIPDKDTMSVQKPEIKILDETKVIAGYKCKKAEITSPNGDVMEVYYTEEIPSIEESINSVEGIKGALLEFSTNISDAIMTYKAKEVKKGKPKAHLFKIPDGYDVMTMEEFMKMMGQ